MGLVGRVYGLLVIQAPVLVRRQTGLFLPRGRHFVYEL